MAEKKKKKQAWNRHRFHANPDDPRPVKFPPPGPYWISGEGDGYAIVVAYLPAGVEVEDFWPEAGQIDTDERCKITFTDRFPKPEWWSHD